MDLRKCLSARSNSPRASAIDRLRCCSGNRRDHGESPPAPIQHRVTGGVTVLLQVQADEVEFIVACDIAGQRRFRGRGRNLLFARRFGLVGDDFVRRRWSGKFAKSVSPTPPAARLARATGRRERDRRRTWR